MELIQAPGLNQSRLSKLTTKLVAAGWIAVRPPKGDRRRRPIITTRAAKKAIAGLAANSLAKPQSDLIHREAGGAGASGPLRDSRSSI